MATEINTDEFSSSAMHRCLQVREVLEEITGYLADGLQKKTLAFLSQTCTMLHGAAQDALWRDANLKLVLQCFPPVCWEMKGTSFRFTRPPALPEWARFLVQAERIQALILDEGIQFDKDVLSTLALYRPIHVLFPRLRLLKTSEDMFHYLPLFANPMLKDLTLVWDNHFDPSNLPPLNNFPHICPSLEKVAFECRGLGHQERTTISHTISDVLQSLANARVIIATGVKLTSDAVIHLSTLPSLCVLRCAVDPDRASADLLHGKPCPFPSLESLEFRFQELDTASGLLLTSSGSSRLSTINLGALEPDNNSLVEVLDSLRKYAASLQQLHFQLLYNLPPVFIHDPLRVINGQVLRHLNLFHNLSKLIITSIFLDLNDKDIWNITGSMPNLVTLVLLPAHYLSSAPLQTTTQSVVSAVTRCRHLSVLGLRFNAADHSWHAPSRTERNGSLSRLRVGDSPIKHPGSLALFLSAVLSRPQISIRAALSNTVSRDRADEVRGYSELWSKVQDLYEVAWTARTQERRTDGDLTYPLDPRPSERQT